MPEESKEAKEMKEPVIHHIPMNGAEVKDFVVVLDMLIQNDKLSATQIESICDYKKVMMGKFKEAPGLIKQG
jgi:hypothetical protein